MREVALRFVGRPEPEPGNRGAGIDGDGGFVSTDCFLRVRIFNTELPVAAQKVPIAGISGLEFRGAFKCLTDWQASEVFSARIANAKIGEKHGSERGS